MPDMELEATVIVQEIAITVMRDFDTEQRKSRFRLATEGKIRSLRENMDHELADAVMRKMESISREYFP